MVAAETNSSGSGAATDKASKGGSGQGLAAAEGKTGKDRASKDDSKDRKDRSRKDKARDDAATHDE